MLALTRPSRMLQAVILLIVLLFAAADQPEEARPAGTHTLWQVKGAHNTVYLLGSLHLLKSTDYPLAPAMEKAFADSQAFVFEVDLSKANDPAAQLMIMNKGALPEGSSVRQHLSKETYALAKQKSSELGVDITGLHGVEPWLLALTLASLKLMTLGFDPAHGVDHYFYSKARAAGRPVIALETIEYQMGLFDTLSAADQEAIVKQTLLDLDVIESEMDSIVAAWREGDVEELEDVLLKSFKEFPSIYRRFILDRNNAWMGTLLPILKEEKNYMIVVGAGHLVGKHGLVALMKKEGYSVDQL